MSDAAYNLEQPQAGSQLFTPPMIAPQAASQSRLPARIGLSGQGPAAQMVDLDTGKPLAPQSAPPSAAPADPLDAVVKRIYGGETGGDPDPYHRLYGSGGHFGFPKWEGRMGPAGITHAAGAGQWQPGTWDAAVKGWMTANPGQPAPNFNAPADQDKITKFWATKRYRDETGRDLAADAAAGKVNYAALAGEWTSLGGGSMRAANEAAGGVRSGYAKLADTYRSQADTAMREAVELKGSVYDQMKLVREALSKSDRAQEEAQKAIGKAPAQPVIDGMQHMAGLATVVGILGGLFTRSPMRASLNAAAAAIEAYNDNDRDTYKRSYDTWKNQTDMLFKIADMNATRVRDVLYAENMGFNERRAAVDVLLRAQGQAALADQAKISGDQWLAEFIEKNSSAQEARKLRETQMEFTHELALARMDQKPEERMFREWEQQWKADPAHNGQPPTLDEQAEAWKKIKGAEAKGQGTIVQQGGKTYRIGAPGTSPEELKFPGEGPVTKLGSGATTPLDDQQATFWAKVLEQGGALPTGLRRSGVVQQIMGKMGQTGDPGDFIAKHAEVAANTGSLRNMQKMADSAISFENLAKKNFDVALTLAPEAVPTELGPFFNRWIEEGEKMFGDPAVPAYIAAIITGANEYAKVMSGSTGTAASTVDSRKEARDLFSPYLSLPQIRQVIAVAKADMANRENTLTEQVDVIKARLSGKPPPQPAPAVMPNRTSASAPGATPSGHKFTGNGGKVYSDDGVTWFNSDGTPYKAP